MSKTLDQGTTESFDQSGKRRKKKQRDVAAWKRWRPGEC